jgi:hypothetical protein
MKKTPIHKRSNNPHGNNLQCPYPGCGHHGMVITKVHCRTVHNMEREELFEKYGLPFRPYIDNNKSAAFKAWKKENYGQSIFLETTAPQTKPNLSKHSKKHGRTF